MFVRDEKSELIEIINSIPAQSIKNFGYGVPVCEIYDAFNGVDEIAKSVLLQLEQEGKVEIFRKPDLDEMILAVRTI